MKRIALHNGKPPVDRRIASTALIITQLVDGDWAILNWNGFKPEDPEYDDYKPTLDCWLKYDGYQEAPGPYVVRWGWLREEYNE